MAQLEDATDSGKDKRGLKRDRNPLSWARVSCGTVALLALISALVVLTIAGFWAYDAIDDKVARLTQQLDRAQDQFDRALDNNDQALKMYDEILVEVEINKR